MGIKDITSQINTDFIDRIANVIMDYESKTNISSEQLIYLGMLSCQLKIIIDFSVMECDAFREVINDNMDCLIYLVFIEEIKKLQDIIITLTEIKDKIDTIGEKYVL